MDLTESEWMNLRR